MQDGVAARPHLDNVLEELLPAGGGRLARPPLPSARHVVPELVLDWPPTSLAAPPPAPTGPRPSRRHLVTFARALLLVACSSPTPLVRHPPQHTLAQLSAHAPSVPRLDAPARARARPRATAPPVTSRVAHRTHAPPAHHIAALATPASLGHLTLTRLRTARRCLPVRPASPASPRGLRPRAAASHQITVGNTAARPSRGDVESWARPWRGVTGTTGGTACGLHERR
jgi:hypothetical protein